MQEKAGPPYKQEVAGSIPAPPTIQNKKRTAVFFDKPLNPIRHGHQLQPLFLIQRDGKPAESVDRNGILDIVSGIQVTL